MKKVISILAALAINIFTVSAGSHSVGPINEIRDYTMEKDWFPQYVVWFEESFLPYLASRNVNVVSASVGTDIPEEVKGSAPSTPKNGFANISYVVQFKNMEERNSFWRNIGSDAAFRKIWGIHPNPYSYLQTTSRFFRAVK